MLRPNWLKLLVFVAGLLPFCWLAWGLFTDRLGANPVEAVTRGSGLWALRFMLITLAVSPIYRLTGFADIMRLRRMLGLFSFFYACVHMLLYLGLDQFFSLADIVDDILDRPFITVGFVSFVLLVPLAMTSSNAMIHRLGGRRWRRLHRLIYPIAAASCLHYMMLVKADIREPLIYVFLLVILLALRLPRVGPARAKAR